MRDAAVIISWNPTHKGNVRKCIRFGRFVFRENRREVLEIVEAEWTEAKDWCWSDFYAGMTVAAEDYNKAV